MVLVGGALLGNASRGGSLFSNDTSSSAQSSTRRTNPSAASSVNRPERRRRHLRRPPVKVQSGLVNITTTLAGGTGEGAGTGMVISSDGEVLTNNHVIENADTINVEIGGNGSSHTAKVIGYDVADDVALVKIDDVSGLDTIPVGNPDKVVVDDPIVVIGNALGRGGDPTATSGTVTALNRQITATDSDGSNAETLTQHDPGAGRRAAGRLRWRARRFERRGDRHDHRRVHRRLPVPAAVRGRGVRHPDRQGAVGDQADPQRRRGRRRPRRQPCSPRCGAPGATASPAAVVAAARRPSSNGALVTGVGDGTRRQDAGIQTGDVIVSVGGATITSSSDLQDVMNKYHAGDKVEVGWTNSSGDTQHATLKLDRRPARLTDSSLAASAGTGARGRRSLAINSLASLLTIGRSGRCWLAALARVMLSLAEDLRLVLADVRWAARDAPGRPRGDERRAGVA